MGVIVWLTLLLLIWVGIWDGIMIWPLMKAVITDLKHWYQMRNGGRIL